MNVTIQNTFGLTALEKNNGIRLSEARMEDEKRRMGEEQKRRQEKLKHRVEEEPKRRVEDEQKSS